METPMFNIKTWKEYKISTTNERKLVVCCSDNKEVFIKFFAGIKLLFCDNIIELSAFNEPLDIIICPKVYSQDIMKINRNFINSAVEINLYLGGKDEYLNFLEKNLYYHSVLLSNNDIKNIYSEITIPLYEYFQQIYIEESMAYGIIVNYKKEYSLREFMGQYVFSQNNLIKAYIY